MKRRKAALVLSLAMLTASIPAGALIVSAEEFQEDFVSAEENIGEAAGFVSGNSNEAIAEDENQVGTVEEGETASILEPNNDAISVGTADQVDTGLTVEIDGEDIVYVQEGASTELKVKADCAEEYKPLKYQWYIHYDVKEMMDEETNPVLKCGYDDFPMPYSCTVTDTAGNSKSVIMYICPEKYKDKFAPDFDHAKDFVLGEENIAFCGISWDSCFKFVPNETGTWKISAPEGIKDSGLEIYNSVRKRIKSDYPDNRDAASIELEMQKGETYYIRCNCLEQNVSYLLNVEYKKECNHQWKTVIDQAATCGKAGSQHNECTVCGLKEAATEIPATGNHTYGEYVVTKEATVVEEGTKVRTCSVCGASDSAVIPKLPGTIQVTVTKVPLQVKKSIGLDKLVTGFATGDSIDVAACTSSNASVAAIENGAVKAKKAGTTVVTIRLASGVSAQVTVTVQKKAVATTSINVVKNITLAAGEKQKLTPVVSPITSLNKVTYSSSNTKVAVVAKDGTITAKKSGTATIKVKCGKKTVNVKVKVTKKAPTGMTGVPATKTLKKGKSFTLKAKLTPSGSEAKITYKSSNSKVVSVSAKGKVKAKKKGTATITVKAGNVTKTCVVTVK